MTIKYENLLGRVFVHGKQDCFSIGRDFFKQNWGIEIPDFARPDKWWEAEEAGLNLYQNHYHECGFRVVDPEPHIRDLWPGDVFLMAIMTKVPCHAGIWLGQDNLMLHHYITRLSDVTVYKGLWKNNTTAILRHKDVPRPNTSKDVVELMDLLPVHMRARLTNAGAT